MAANYPQVTTDQYHIDGLTIQLILNPQRFDVIVASNLFGDIISDIGPATAGTIGIAPSACINPESTAPSLFEPVHGSAPDIYGPLDAGLRRHDELREEPCNAGGGFNFIPRKRA